jgi:hypothetical protein
MRRHSLHAAAAALACLSVLLAAAGREGLAYLLAFAPAAYVIVGALRRLDFDFHFLLVAALCVFLWSAGFVALSAHLSMTAGSCVIDFPEAEAAPSPPAPAEAVITLERTSCYGRCPRYSLSIFADGSVVFYASPPTSFTRVTGAARGEITREKMRELEGWFEAADYFSFNDRYRGAADGCPTYSTDAATVITSYRKAGRHKQVVHYHGCEYRDERLGVYPLTLTRLEEKIDELAGSRRWVGEPYGSR